MAKRANGEGSKPRKKANGRYEARATVETPAGRKRVSFYGADREGGRREEDRGRRGPQPRGALLRPRPPHGRRVPEEVALGRRPLPGRGVHPWPLPEDVRQPPDTVLRTDKTPRPLPAPRPRLQGPQDRRGPQPQHRRRDARSPFGGIQPGGRRRAHLSEPRERPQEGRYSPRGARKVHCLRRRLRGFYAPPRARQTGP